MKNIANKFYFSITQSQIKPVINVLEENYLPFLETKWHLMAEQYQKGYSLDDMVDKKNLHKYMISIQKKYEAETQVQRKEFLLLGRSNVGKSSIINSLFQAQAAFTSKYPGKTRHLCFFRVSNQDQNLILCDAPGYGFAKRTKSEMQSWGEMMGLYISKSMFLHRVYVIIDASVGFIEVDKMVFKMLEQKQRPFQIVFSKVDKLKTEKEIIKLSEGLQELKQYNMFMPFVNFTSTKNQFGINQLRQCLAYTMNEQIYQGT